MGRRKEVTTYICIFIVMFIVSGCTSSKENNVAIMAEESMSIINAKIDASEEKTTMSTDEKNMVFETSASNAETSTIERSSYEADSNNQTTKKQDNLATTQTIGLNNGNSTVVTQNQQPSVNKPSGSVNVSPPGGYAPTVQHTVDNSTTSAVNQETQSNIVQNTTEIPTVETMPTVIETTQSTEVTLDMQPSEVADDSGDTEG